MVNEPLTNGDVSKVFFDKWDKCEHEVVLVYDVLSAKQGLVEDIYKLKQVYSEDDTWVFHTLDLIEKWFPLSDQPLSPVKAKAVDGEQKVGSKESTNKRRKSLNFRTYTGYGIDKHGD